MNHIRNVVIPSGLYVTPDEIKLLTGYDPNKAISKSESGGMLHNVVFNKDDVFKADSFFVKTFPTKSGREIFGIFGEGKESPPKKTSQKLDDTQIQLIKDCSKRLNDSLKKIGEEFKQPIKKQQAPFIKPTLKAVVLEPTPVFKGAIFGGGRNQDFIIREKVQADFKGVIFR